MTDHPEVNALLIACSFQEEGQLQGCLEKSLK